MLVIPVRGLLEHELEEARKVKNLSGKVEQLSALLAEENQRRLDQRFPAFAFIAFHPGADDAVSEYLRGPTVTSDAGEDLLVLFSLARAASGVTILTEDLLEGEIRVDSAVHPAYRLISSLFEPEPRPALPGVALFQSFLGNTDVVYVPLDAPGDAQQVRSLLRPVFATAEESTAKKSFADHLAARLRRQRIEYVRTGASSLGEKLVAARQYAGEHTFEIAAAITAGAGLA